MDHVRSHGGCWRLVHTTCVAAPLSPVYVQIRGGGGRASRVTSMSHGYVNATAYTSHLSRREVWVITVQVK